MVNKSLDVQFEAVIRLLDEEVPEDLDDRSIAQTIQNLIGHTGARVEVIIDSQYFDN